MMTFEEVVEAAGGIDWVCEQLEADKFHSEIAKELGFRRSTLANWIYADKGRTARARASMKLASLECDRRALEILNEIPNGNDPGAIARAREMASHLRWRAKVRDPEHYGDKCDVKLDATVKEMTDEQVESRLSQLLRKAGVAGVDGRAGTEESAE